MRGECPVGLQHSTLNVDLLRPPFSPSISFDGVELCFIALSQDSISSQSPIVYGSINEWLLYIPLNHHKLILIDKLVELMLDQQVPYTELQALVSRGGA